MYGTPEYSKAIKDRLDINIQANKDMSARNEILRKCYEDPVFWCNNFGWTYDPRKVFFPEVNLPFVLFPKQIELVKWIEVLLANKLSGLVEKSREMGVSNTVLIPIVLHHFLFREFSTKIGSRKEEYVDRPGDMDALFPKIVYNLERLPKWMLPEGFDLKKHVTYMKITRPDNQNTITGESANPNFSRGGRQNLVLFDEFGFWENARASWESAGDSTPTRLAVSTPPLTGRSSHMYKLSTGEMGRVERLMLHYKDDPRKDAKWEADQRANKSDEEFEREQNISYEGSVQGTVYAANYNNCDFGLYPYKPELPLYCCWDYGLDGVAMQWYQWDHKYDRWYLVDSYFNQDKEIEYFVPFVTGVMSSQFAYDVDEEEMIAEHAKWRKDITHFGDPDVNKRSLHTKSSTKDILRKHNILIQSKPHPGHFDMKQKTIMFLRKLSIDEKKNEFFSDAIRNARYPKKAETSQSTGGITQPIHDWTSHHRSCLEYMAQNAPTKYLDKVESERRATSLRELAKKRIVNPLTGF